MSAHEWISNHSGTPIVDPFRVRYEGVYADGGFLEAGELGKSISGAARLYTATVHYCVSGVVPRGRYRKTYACYATASRQGSLEELFALLPLVHGFGIQTEFYREAVTHVFNTIIGAVVDHWIRPSESHEVAGRTGESLLEDTARVHNLDSLLANGLVRSNEQLARGLIESNKQHAKLSKSLMRALTGTLPLLADRTRSGGRDFVEPIGKSCASLTQFDGPYETRISETDAEIIRGDDDTEVDSVATFKVIQLSEINVKTGHCILVLDDSLRIIQGRISDPDLQVPNNVYTRALNERKGFVAHAKAVRKHGEIYRLYISDAEPL